jgi:hypothetical protein
MLTTDTRYDLKPARLHPKVHPAVSLTIAKRIDWSISGPVAWLVPFAACMEALET